jgi:hypothetical protein
MGWFGLSGTSSSSRHGHHSSSSRPSNHRSSSVFSRASSSHSRSGSSYYKRRPRDGYVERLIHKLKQLFRELYYYARRNPAKLFFFVIMPLISGGVLAGVARQFGVKVPAFLQGHGGGRSSRGGGGGGGYYGSKGYGEEEHERGGGGIAGGIGGLGNLGSLMSVAKAFM